MKKIECIILDWAGTAVDYGCFAPVAAFVGSFRKLGLTVSDAETRAHMGLTKIEEIRALFRLEHVADEFRQKYGRDYNENDIQACYAEFQERLCATLPVMPVPFRALSRQSAPCVHRASRSVRPPATPVR